MPITENVGGVLKTHSAEYANISGVIKEQSIVTANDGGVLRKVFSSDKFKLEGITPLVVADDHIVITQSGSGTISLPAGARIILGSGAQGTDGGYVAEYTLTSSIINAQFTATVGAAGNRVKDATKLVIGGSTYGCGSTKQVIDSRWGPIGGDGGTGAYGYTEPDDDGGYDVYDPPESGTGAGGGGGGVYSDCRGGNGGNRQGYGNRGGDGGYHDNDVDKQDFYGRAGSSGAAQTSVGNNTTYFGNGGGGGYSAGGGGRASLTTERVYYYGKSGNPGAGIIVIEL